MVSFDFISLNKLGIGCILLRYSEIVEMSPTPEGYTSILLSTGDRLIVNEGPMDILKIIKNLENLKQQSETE